jgi:hypothetical protein
MHLKVFMKLKKKPKNPLVWAKNPKKTKKPKKTQKTPKKTLGWFFFKPGFFPTLPVRPVQQASQVSYILSLKRSSHSEE